MKKKMFGMAMLALSMMFVPVHGADGEMDLTFEGDSEKFITYEQSKAYENMAPGEERIQRVVLTNDDHREMKFYIRSEYTNPLGEGVANEQIAYDITFSNNGEVFYQGKIGGMTKVNMDSLEANYLLATLAKGEQTAVDMAISVDGDSMDNSYQNTVGYLNIIFSVEYDDPTPMEQVVDVMKDIPIVNKLPGVNTGDTTAVGAILGVFAGSVVILIVLGVLAVKKRKEGKQDEK